MAPAYLRQALRFLILILLHEKVRGTSQGESPEKVACLRQGSCKEPVGSRPASSSLLLQVETSHNTLTIDKLSDRVAASAIAELADSTKKGNDDTVEDSLAGIPGSVNITVEAYTGTSAFSGTETGANVAFEVHQTWTQTMPLVIQADVGEAVAMSVRLAAWPTKIRIQAQGPDAWNVDSVVVVHGGTRVTVLETGSGQTKYAADSTHWIDSYDEAPASMTLDVPSLEALAQHRAPDGANKTCTTRADKRVWALGYTTADPGSKCVFGVDPRDEGLHCIMDDAQFGTLGWCFTNKEGSSWGSCSADCPLFGQEGILGDKIDDFINRLDEQGQILMDTVEKMRNNASNPEAQNNTSSAADADRAPKAETQ